ncbi:MAG TPA: sodium/proton-translocating pyrophosphatase, partial [Steroidobacteraceae bacterium]|nr:sodium/proton-translocating pyrophosphatase [Steroidobacteraceae bacterium]
AIGFLRGAQALAGALAGAIVVGATLSLLMANAGAAWDNAKRFNENGPACGGTKKAPTFTRPPAWGDTVGDPFKDTSGPGESILIKVMAVVSLLITPLLN